MDFLWNDKRNFMRDYVYADLKKISHGSLDVRLFNFAVSNYPTVLSLSGNLSPDRYI